MDLLAEIAVAAALAWASGLRLYATLFLVGLAGHFGLITLPATLQVLQGPWMLIVSGVLTGVEFFADKIPWLDSLWDAVHTFIRIPGGAALAAGVFGDSSATATLTAALLGGGVTAGTHFAKAGGRALVNTSPEPFSNWTKSFAEDLLVPAGLWAGFTLPLLFLGLLLCFLLTVAWLLPKFLRALRGLFGSPAKAGGKDP